MIPRERIPYFAYGANLDRKAMRRRAPGARVLERGSLRGWRFIIAASGWASIRPEADGVVEGLLWSLGSEDLAALDAFEDLAGGLYRLERVEVDAAAGGRIAAWTYIESSGGTGRPDRAYLEAILRAAREQRFPEAYLSELARWG